MGPSDSVGLNLGLAVWHYPAHPVNSVVAHTVGLSQVGYFIHVGVAGTWGKAGHLPVIRQWQTTT